MNKAQFYLLWTAIGVILGGFLADLVAPPYLSWYHAPGGGSAMCDCMLVTTSTAASMVHAHLAGAIVGGLLFFAAAVTLRWTRGAKTAGTP